MRAIPLELLAEEAGVSIDLIERFVELGQVRPMPDRRYDARDAGVLTTVTALLAAGTDLEDLAGRAGPGDIVVEEGGVVVALPHGTATFEPIGRVPLKGFSDPVAVWKAHRPDAGGG